nr:MAG: DUF2905 domain-containing protein [Pseudomonadota bacterium]
MQRTLVVIGIAIVAIGLAWPWLSKLPIGRLPGDILVERPGFRFYFPLATSLIISALVTLVLWLMRR